MTIATRNRAAARLETRFDYSHILLRYLITDSAELMERDYPQVVLLKAAKDFQGHFPQTYKGWLDA